MNFAQMLLSTVEPQKPKTRKRGDLVKRCEDANHARRQQAIDRYRAVWGDDEWLHTHVIETRLGVCRATGITVLTKWWKQGILERKNAREPFVKRYGYLWRWVK